MKSIPKIMSNWFGNTWNCCVILSSPMYKVNSTFSVISWGVLPTPKILKTSGFMYFTLLGFNLARNSEFKTLIVAPVSTRADVATWPTLTLRVLSKDCLSNRATVGISSVLGPTWSLSSDPESEATVLLPPLFRFRRLLFFCFLLLLSLVLAPGLSEPVWAETGAKSYWGNALQQWAKWSRLPHLRHCLP